MAVLLEGVSLVFENEVLERKYPGGVLGFRANWSNGSFCSDGTVSRIAYFETDDAFCTLMAMPDYGLDVSTEFAADVAVFIHGGAAWTPCLWLETSHAPESFQVCWHVTEEQGERFAVPKYFRRDSCLARYRSLDELAIRKRLKLVGEENGEALYRDQKLGTLLCGPNPLSRH